MRITAHSGVKVLEQYKDRVRSANFPVAMFLLVPSPSRDELMELVHASRLLDRMTGSLILVVLFWKPFRSVTYCTSDDTFRSHLLAGELEEDSLQALRHGLVDEATALAIALGIPLAELPLIVIFDNPDSDEFYRIRYNGVESVNTLARMIADFLRMDYPEFSSLTTKLDALEDTRLRMRRGINRFRWEAAGRLPQVAGLLEHVLARISAGRSMESEEAAQLLRYIKHNPNDLCAASALQRRLASLGVPFEPSAYHESWRRHAEILAFGHTIDSVDQKIAELSEALSKCDRPSLGKVLKRVALTDKIQRMKVGSRMSATFSIAERLLEFLKTISSL